MHVFEMPITTNPAAIICTSECAAAGLLGRILDVDGPLSTNEAAWSGISSCPTLVSTAMVRNAVERIGQAIIAERSYESHFTVAEVVTLAETICGIAHMPGVSEAVPQLSAAIVDYLDSIDANVEFDGLLMREIPWHAFTPVTMSVVKNTFDTAHGETLAGREPDTVGNAARFIDHFLAGLFRAMK